MKPINDGELFVWDCGGNIIYDIVQQRCDMWFSHFKIKLKNLVKEREETEEIMCHIVVG